MEVSILKDNSVKYTRYYIYKQDKDFRIPNYFPIFFEGDKINKSPLAQAKRLCKKAGIKTLIVFQGHGKGYKTHKL
jgi:hypothetical protein